MKPKVIIGIVAIIGFTTLLMINFGKSIGSYTDFAHANNQKNAHVVGTWNKSKPSGFSKEHKRFTFYMKDQDWNVRKVIYPKPEPNNFTEAKQLVVIGQMHDGIFYANDMLMKCPSKYNASPEDVQAQSTEAQSANL